MNSKRISLNGIWKMKRIGDVREYDARVPGSVLSALLENGDVEDPFYRRNEYRVREMFREDYEFQREFEIPDLFAEEEEPELVCEGLDTLAEIRINGNVVGKADNMHRTWRIPVREVLQKGRNSISIRFFSPLKFIDGYEYGEGRTVQYVPCGCMRGNHLLRKAHSMFGWDWGPQLPDMGIFRDIYLESRGRVRLGQIYIKQIHENGTVKLNVKAECYNSKEDMSLSVSLSAPENSGNTAENSIIAAKSIESIPVCRKDDRISAETELEVSDPKLWWPAGYGAQSLYRVTVRLCDRSGRLLDEIQKTIGMRTLTVIREKDEWGREFAFQVNGVKIFAMGGNYIPEDCVYSRITEERQEYLVKSMVRANFNCVRVWGGGYYPADHFYDLCDRYGLIVWQDLMFACNVYEVTDHFAENCRREVKENLERLRHHACLGLICGNNEIESAWDHWEEFQKESLYLRADYIRLFEEILPKAVAEAAPDTFYWPSSPSSGGCFADPDNENNGDTHYWAVWHGQLPFTDFGNHWFRFCSEFGFQSFPCMKTVESFTEEEDRNIFSRVMESHQKNDAANGKILYYLSENFRYPSTLEHTVYISQVMQGMAVRYGAEHWRRHRGRCMGALYWQVNDNWPAPSWSSMDYYGRWKALHYMAKEFFARRTSSLEVKDGRFRLWAENETDLPQKYRMKIILKKMDLTVVAEVSGTGEAGAFTSVCGAEFAPGLCEAYLELKRNCGPGEDPEEELFVEGVVIFEDGTVCRSVETLLPYKYLRLPEPVFRGEISESETTYEICLESDCFAAFTELSVSGADVIFSENYFHLTGQKKRIRIKKEDISGNLPESTVELKERLRIRSVVSEKFLTLF